jgi:two-component system alkaline phosphatase synthesis response regulator PhoP
VTVAADAPSALVAIIEDDAAIAAGLGLNLGLQGYRTEVANDGDAALTLITDARPDLVLLDISLPKQTGLQVLEALRAGGDQTPVIILSARQHEFDKVAALQLGADDYVTKPFALAELMARVAAVLRRTRRSEVAVVNELRFGDVRIDLAARSVTRAGATVALTHLETELLIFFCRNADRVFPRDELVREVWGLRSSGQPRTVDNFVAQLRAKLEPDPDQPIYFVTVRGSGYRFVPP